MLDLLWQSVTWAWNQMEELRTREEEIEDLGQEEEKHGLGEVALNGHRRKCHAGEVAEGVARERSRRVPRYQHSLR